MLLQVEGTDLTSKVSIDGLTWTEQDIHSDDSGRDMDGTMHIKVIAKKVQLSISCVALSQENAMNLLTALDKAPPLTVTYTDPKKGTRTANFYPGDRNCEFMMECRGVVWWKNIKFDLTEA